MGKLTICIKEDIDVNLDFFNNQLGLDCEQLLVEFFLEGQNHANGYNFGYYTFLCCCDCLPASNVQIARFIVPTNPLTWYNVALLLRVG